ncbi:hypothetical protein [uncultured Tateyamaria sp.]|uniref:hypothetical protein n=1 Tax=Tateyamaria sp. 1078 TaxID=3417464 RepID=UPI00262EA584|nr:hypothetical protein [uncultured Tateyamaria sp.]
MGFLFYEFVWSASKTLALFTALAKIQLWVGNADSVAQIFPNRDWVFSVHGGRNTIAVQIYLLT